MALKIERLPVRPGLIDVPLQLPINVLLALPLFSQRAKSQPFFNLPGAINRLLGGDGWQRAMMVMRPHILAPGWSREALRDVLTAPFGDQRRPLSEKTVEQMFVDNRGALQLLWGSVDKPAHPSYAVRHYTGNAIESFPYYFPWLQVRGRRNLPQTFTRSGTRLVIAEVRNIAKTAAWAQGITAAGGPAVLLVEGGNAKSLETYFTRLYAEIIHNRPLSEIAGIKEGEEISAYLTLGEGADNLLSFDRWTDQLFSRIQTLSTKHVSFTSKAKSELAGYWTAYFHRQETPKWKGYVGEIVDRHAGSIGSSIQGLHRKLDFSRESGGAFPLADLAESLPNVEATVDQLYPQLKRQAEEDLKAAAQRAPRVLNANFADREKQEVTPPERALIAGREYDLLVDVGPRWSEIPSIVRGNSNFPEKALPAGQSGFLVKVVFVSEHFRPHLSSAWMWVPAKTGRSYPWYPERTPEGAEVPAKGRQAEKPGPVLLPLIPEVSREASGEGVLRSEGRLCLYYEGNLLQSASIRTAVAPKPLEQALERPNEVVVDFTLSNSLQDVEAKYGRRAVRFGDSTEDAGGHPVRVNFTLNGNGQGDHRIIITGPASSQLPAAGWSQYKPLSADALLKSVRDALVSCFMLRDEQGRLTGKSALLKDNWKDYAQFRFDLYLLAEAGAKLFREVTGPLNVEGGGAALD